jgi:hypothetical protein
MPTIDAKLLAARLLIHDSNWRELPGNVTQLGVSYFYAGLRVLAEGLQAVLSF